MKRVIHVDMDAFYASVEVRDDPSLAGKPLIVGGRSPRSVVTTASYEARRFGVKSAMSMIEAVRRCPQATVVEPRMSAYAAASEEVMAILRSYSPLCEPLSLDEAFLDVTASETLFGPAVEIAKAIRARIRADLRLTASAGVATSKFVAKIASDLDKPDGLTVVPPGEEQAFLAPLAIDRMWGVGPKSAVSLRAEGFHTIGDLVGAPPAKLRKVLGSWGEEIVRLARGEDPREVTPARAAKSIGSEETFERDVHSASELEPHLLAQAGRVAMRLTAEGLLCRTVSLKVKYADHKSVTRQATLKVPACDTQSLYEAARELLGKVDLSQKGVRLTGVQASGLEEAAREQRTLFQSAATDRRRTLERALHDVREKFGTSAVVQARTMETTRRRG